jgi:hypothetical protein
LETAKLLVQWSRSAETRLKSLNENQATFAQAMASLAESQARFSEAQASLAEEHTKLAAEHTKLAAEQTKLAAAQTKLAAAQANSEFKIAALTDAQIRTDEAMAALSEQMKEMVAQAAHTDRRLDALINMVQSRREGQPPPQT